MVSEPLQSCVRLCLAITLRTKVTPVHKVSELLQNLIVKATVEKGTETQVYSEFATKTNDAVRELGYEMEKLNTRIHVQEADQESAEAELGQTQERLTDVGASNVMISICVWNLIWLKCPSQAKLTRAQQQWDASVKQHADEKSVFDVNFQDG